MSEKTGYSMRHQDEEPDMDPLEDRVMEDLITDISYGMWQEDGPDCELEHYQQRMFETYRKTREQPEDQRPGWVSYIVEEVEKARREG